MIFGTNSNYMLKYQKAKAKLVEYDIPQKDYPKFPLNSNELSYPVIYILSRYAESIIENDETGKAEFAPYMVKASQYFDASVGANDRTAYDADFLLSGAAAYFLSNDFGSSKVLCAALFEKIKDMPTTGTSQIILRNLLGYLLLDKVFPISSDAPALEAKNISPEIDLPPHSVYLNSDYSMVERILQNLLTNAIRYSSGDIKMGLKQTRKNRAIFTIENPIDSKTEINPARLFERFYTGDASRHNSGTGVGLAVVKLLTDKLGGNVSAEIKSNVLTVTLEIH